jgi:hypothetical protein
MVSINLGNNAMQYIEEINVNDNLAFYRYVIDTSGEKIIIKYRELGDNYRDIALPDEKMDIIQMHIANIPDLVTGIFKVFQSNNQDVWKTKTHSDNLSAYMADNERVFLRIVIFDHSGRVPQARSNLIEFKFEDGGIDINDPFPHMPTPSMIRVTDRLMQIYYDWKDKNGGAVV